MDKSASPGEILVYRSEIKYIVGQSEYETLRLLLGSILQPDPYMHDPRGYRIRSLYFDSVGDTDYIDKLDGVENRKKIRLRIYDVAAQTVKFEIKNRFNDYNLKETLSVSKADALSLIAGRYDALLRYDSRVAQKAYCIMASQHYTPKALIEYIREAYVYPQQDVRITFDKDVRAARTDALFDGGVALAPVFDEPTIILEVKFNHFLPGFVRDMLAVCKGSVTSVSKYCLARDLYE